MPIIGTSCAWAANATRRLGSSSVSSPGTEPVSIAKSSPPSIMAIRRGACSAMSLMWASARGCSIMAPKPAAHRHAALLLELADRLVEQPEVLHALGLGDEQGREPG